jgi:hypothetical protein
MNVFPTTSTGNNNNNNNNSINTCFSFSNKEGKTWASDHETSLVLDLPLISKQNAVICSGTLN